METHRLRLLVKPFGVAKLDASESQISIQFGPNPPIDPAKVIFLIQKDRSTKMAGPDRLIRTANQPNLKLRVQGVKELLQAVRA